jgi:hypothetical protein
MRRKALIVLLALGTVVGYGSAIARMRNGCHYGGWQGRHARFEERVADICADAALRARPDRPPPRSP